jgi:hypothetical protein
VAAGLSVNREPLPRTPAWWGGAYCRAAGAPLDVFFPDGGTGNEDAVVDAVRALYCDLCPVRNQCLASATALNDVGIFGGTTTAQRLKLRRKRARASCALCHGSNVYTDGSGKGAHQVCLHCGVSWQMGREPGGEKEMRTYDVKGGVL